MLFRMVYAIPFILGFLIILFLSMKLTEDKSYISTYNRKYIGNFTSSTIDGKILDSKDLLGQQYILSVFSSWCIKCKKNHDILNKVKNDIPIYGLAIHDNKRNIEKYLIENGNPYKEIMLDNENLISIELGISSIPEIFVVNEDGIVILRLKSFITKEIYNDIIQPLIR